MSSKTSTEKQEVVPADVEVAGSESNTPTTSGPHKVSFFHSTLFNALVLGLCNFLAPGIWGAMNSLGGGGDERPYLVNAANALTFCLMVLSCMFGSLIVKYIGIKWTFILGTAGYAPFAAGLYVHNRYGADWFVLLGAALCGLSAGIFWLAEAAIALAYPEPWNQGRFLGLWLSFRVGGQILGGAINLGLNSKRNQEGKVGYGVFEVFIALQALGPVAGLLLSKPDKVQRKDGVKVRLSVQDGSWRELGTVGKLFISRDFLFIVPLIAQAVYSEAVFYSFVGLWFSVRARALGSFMAGTVALIAGNILGAWLDAKRVSLKKRSRYAFFIVLTLQGCWWIWATILVTKYNKTTPVYDWVDKGFGAGFALFLFWVAGFQLNYLYLYFVVGNLAQTEEDVVRYAGLLRGTESAVQAVSYGLASLDYMAAAGNVYLNFGLWGISLVPAWLVIKKIGVSLGDAKIRREAEQLAGF